MNVNYFVKIIHGGHLPMSFRDQADKNTGLKLWCSILEERGLSPGRISFTALFNCHRCSAFQLGFFCNRAIKGNRPT